MKDEPARTCGDNGALCHGLTVNPRRLEAMTFQPPPARKPPRSRKA